MLLLIKIKSRRRFNFARKMNMLDLGNSSAQVHSGRAIWRVVPAQ
jgi:hypothetical protein